jgi:hypothetical protein
MPVSLRVLVCVGLTCPLPGKREQTSGSVGNVCPPSPGLSASVPSLFEKQSRVSCQLSLYFQELKVAGGACFPAFLYTEDLAEGQ